MLHLRFLLRQQLLFVKLRDPLHRFLCGRCRLRDINECVVAGRYACDEQTVSSYGDGSYPISAVGTGRRES